MDSNDLQLRPPTHWQQFEDLCLEIFRGVWKDPKALKNGRIGQPQHGTDVYGYSKQRTSRLSRFISSRTVSLQWSPMAPPGARSKLE